MKNKSFLLLISLVSLIGCNTHKHELKHFDLVEPTGFNNGKKEHYECTSCYKYYEDKDAKKEIKESDLIISAKKSITFDETTSIPGEDETFITKEGDKITNNDYGYITKSTGYYCVLPVNGYICLFDIKGINNIKITAKGKADIRTSNVKWGNFTSVTQYEFGDSDTTLEIKLDGSISNDFYIYAKGDTNLYIKSLEITINNEVAQALKDEDILSRGTLNNAATSFVSAHQQRGVVNNSDSALSVDVLYGQVESPITLKLDKTYTIDSSKQLKFDVKTDSVNKLKCAVKLFNKTDSKTINIETGSSFESFTSSSIQVEWSFDSIQIWPNANDKCSLIFDNMSIVSI